MRRLEANLAALPADLAHAIDEAGTRDDEVFITSREGSPVNGLARARRPALFHSGYDPRREASRLADAAGSAGFVVVLGMGTAHHVRELASRGKRVLLVEPDLRLLHTALARVDLSGPLRDGTLAISRPGHLEADLARRYVAPLHGDLAVVELTGRVSAEPAVWAPYREQLARHIDALRSDLAVQARFGLRWMRNTILNVPSSRARTLPSLPGTTVNVAAAGPTLADRLPHIAADAKSPLVAVDTALPVLAAHGLRPHLVVSIDCQLPTYHHYLTAGFPRVPVAAELSLPPSLFARLSTRRPVRSDHPLHALLSRLGLELPYVDARGGNVTQAAVDLAVRLGARDVVVFGADFSYPDGETYPRGSYVHRLFAASASRLSSASTRHYAFLLDRPGVERDPDEPSRWVQPLLSSYAERFAGFAAGLGTGVARVRGRGAPVAASGRFEDLTAPASPDPEHEGVRPKHRRQADGLPAGATAPIPDDAGPGAVDAGVPKVAPDEVLRRLRDAVHGVSSPEGFVRAIETQTGEPPAAARALLPALTCLRADDATSAFGELLARATDLVDAYVDAALERCEGE